MADTFTLIGVDFVKYFPRVYYMPISKIIKAQHLVPGKKYLIDVQWNLTNNLRMQTSDAIIGVFVRNTYVRGRTGSFDSGLQILLSRSRYESTFLVDGEEHTVSSVNKFYEVITPSACDFAMIRNIYALPLPLDLKKIVGRYLGRTRRLHYKPRSKK